MRDEILTRQELSSSTHNVKLIAAGKLLLPLDAKITSFGLTEGAFIHAVVGKIPIPSTLSDSVDPGIHGEDADSDIPLAARGLDRLRYAPISMTRTQVETIRRGFRDSIAEFAVSSHPRRPDEDEAEHRFRVEEEWMRLQEEESIYAVRQQHNQYQNEPADSEERLGSYSDLFYGFAMGVVLGIFMLIGIWDGTVSYRQKVGIIMGVLVNLTMSSNYGKN
jgi:hypothetical protein